MPTALPLALPWDLRPSPSLRAPGRSSGTCSCRVIPTSRWGEEGPAGPRALGRLRAGAGSWAQPGQQPPPAPAAQRRGERAARFSAAVFRDSPDQELYAFPSFTWKILFPC